MVRYFGVLSSHASRRREVVPSASGGAAYHIPAGSEGRNLVDVDLAEAGIPTEDEFVADYCRAVGREVPANLRYFTVFALFRSAAILQGVYKRGLDGNASSETALKLGAVVSVVAGRAWDLAQKMG
jgi:aminoglycoside phosphotransferase (APT) family kinase protein